MKPIVTNFSLPTERTHQSRQSNWSLSNKTWSSRYCVLYQILLYRLFSCDESYNLRNEYYRKRIYEGDIFVVLESIRAIKFILLDGNINNIVKLVYLDRWIEAKEVNDQKYVVELNEYSKLLAIRFLHSNYYSCCYAFMSVVNAELVQLLYSIASYRIYCHDEDRGKTIFTHNNNLFQKYEYYHYNSRYTVSKLYVIGVSLHKMALEMLMIIGYNLPYLPYHEGLYEDTEDYYEYNEFYRHMKMLKKGGVQLPKVFYYYGAYRVQRLIACYKMSCTKLVEIDKFYEPMFQLISRCFYDKCEYLNQYSTPYLPSLHYFFYSISQTKYCNILLKTILSLLSTSDRHVLNHLATYIKICLEHNTQHVSYDVNIITGLMVGCYFCYYSPNLELLQIINYRYLSSFHCEYYALIAKHCQKLIKDYYEKETRYKDKSKKRFYIGWFYAKQCFIFLKMMTIETKKYYGERFDEGVYNILSTYDAMSSWAVRGYFVQSYSEEYCQQIIRVLAASRNIYINNNFKKMKYRWLVGSKKELVSYTNSKMYQLASRFPQYISLLETGKYMYIMQSYSVEMEVDYYTIVNGVVPSADMSYCLNISVANFTSMNNQKGRQKYKYKYKYMGRMNSRVSYSRLSYPRGTYLSLVSIPCKSVIKYFSYQSSPELVEYYQSKSSIKGYDSIDIHSYTSKHLGIHDKKLFLKFKLLLFRNYYLELGMISKTKSFPIVVGGSGASSQSKIKLTVEIYVSSKYALYEIILLLNNPSWLKCTMSNNSLKDIMANTQYMFKCQYELTNLKRNIYEYKVLPKISLRYVRMKQYYWSVHTYTLPVLPSRFIEQLGITDEQYAEYETQSELVYRLIVSTRVMKQVKDVVKYLPGPFLEHNGKYKLRVAFNDESLQLLLIFAYAGYGLSKVSLQIRAIRVYYWPEHYLSVVQWCFRYILSH